MTNRLWLLTLQAISLTRRTARRRLGLERTIYVQHRTDEYRRYWQEAAHLIGASFREISPGYWEIARNGRHTRIHLSVLKANDQVVAAMCSDKPLAYRLAQAAGVPVPAHLVFRLDELAEAQRHRARHPAAYVVKPANNTSAGIGVTTFVRAASELRRAAVLASLFNPEVLLEHMAAGESCRLLVVDGKLVHAVRRRGVRVCGDGRTSVAELMRREGARLDAIARWTLATQGLGPSSVPAAGSEVLARVLPADTSRRNELRTVYTEDITPLVGAGLVDEVARVAAALEARIAGVDVVTADPSRSLSDSGGVLLEVNPQPGIHHHYISEDDYRTHPVAVRVLQALLES